MRLVLRGLAIAVVAAVALAAAVAVFGHTSRGATSPAVSVAPSLVAEKGGRVWLYAARVPGGVVLFDAGLDPDGAPVDVALSALGATRDEVTDVFLTHGHVDQRAGVGVLPRAKVHAGAGDVALVAGREAPRGLAEGLLEMLLPRSPRNVDDPMSGESEIRLAGGALVLAIPVPGHSPGSTAYLLDGALFVGDLVSYRDGKLVTGSRYLSADADQNERSAAALSRRLADVPVSRICTSRSRCTPEGRARALLVAFAAEHR